MKKTLTIQYLSSGKWPTGGYLYETFFTHVLQAHLELEGINKPQVSQIRLWKYFQGIHNLRLVLWGFLKSNKRINIVVGRLALSAMLRNLFTQNLNIIIIHNYDERYFSSSFLVYYYRLLFFIFRLFKPKNTIIITGAQYWVDFFSNKANGAILVYCFPSLFDTTAYKKLQTTKTPKLICLGQYSLKNHPDVFVLAKLLSDQGYSCYFATLNPEEQTSTATFTVYYENREAFLNRLASASYCIAFTGVNEGWNRMAHESVLLNTSLIGFDAGGLGSLLKESNSFIVTNAQQAFDIIMDERKCNFSPEFISKYDLSTAKKWMNPISELANSRLVI